MVTIVIGKINAGKTSTLLKQYQSERKGDGFVAVKVFDAGKAIGYNLCRLSSNEQTPWMIDSDHYKNDFKQWGTIGQYYFDLELLTDIENILKEMVRSNVSPIYLDEIGRLELASLGFDAIFKYLLAMNVDLIIAVRAEFVDEVVSHYHIKEFQKVVLTV